MIPCPPGGSVPYNIQIDIVKLTNEMIEWFTMVGGSTITTKNLDWRGREYTTQQVQYGKAKPSHTRLDGSNQVIIRFTGEDASTASMFILKFMDQVVNHNLKEAEHYV